MVENVVALAVILAGVGAGELVRAYCARATARPTPSARRDVETRPVPVR